MKWICPTCGSKWSIPDVDKGKWEGKTRCQFCPPVRKKFSLPKVKITPQQDLDSTLENQSPVSSLQSSVPNDEDHLDILEDNFVQTKAFMPESDNIGEVTADVEKKQFREKGYEGKKRKRGKRKS